MSHTHVADIAVSSGTRRRSAKDKFDHRNSQSLACADRATERHSRRSEWECSCPRGRLARLIVSPTFHNLLENSSNQLRCDAEVSLL